MVTTLSDLSSEVLSTILDLLEASSLLHLVICGNTRLNMKIRSSARRFVDECPPGQDSLWPKCFHHFPALEHVAVRCGSPYNYSLSYDVDLLALPATLRTLELSFSNSLLCLVELPLPSRQPCQPRLRPDLPAKFKHLKRLSWSIDRSLPEMRNWRLDKFTQDLCAWPSLLLAPWPESAPPLTLINTGLLPDTTLALSVLLSGSTKAPETKLPSSLTHLEISGGSTFKKDLLDIVPPNVQTLIIGEQRELWKPPQMIDCNFAPLALLTQLSFLCLSVATFNSEKMLLLPR